MTKKQVFDANDPVFSTGKLTKVRNLSQEYEARSLSQEYADSVRPVIRGFIESAMHTVTEEIANKVRKSIRDCFARLLIDKRCRVTRKDFRDDCERQYEELQDRAYYPEVPGYDPYNHVGKEIMIKTAWREINEALGKTEQVMGTMKGAAKKATKAVIDFSTALATEWEPINEFDQDLADSMVSGLHGYDPRNHIGRQVVDEVLGV